MSAEFFIPFVVILALFAFSCPSKLLRKERSGVVFFHHRHRTLSLAIAFYFLMLLPSFGTFYKNGFVFFASDRYAYLPSIAVFVLLALGCDVLWRRSRALHLPIIGIGILVCAFSLGLTVRQVGYWKDTKTLFRRVLAVYPQSAMAHNNLGAELGKTPEGLAEFQKALAIDPSYLVPIRNIAAYDYQQGDTAHMQLMFERGIAVIRQKQHVTHDDLSLFYEYAEYLDQQGDSARAISLLQEAITFDPNFGQSHYNLGVKYQKYGRIDDAIIELEKAVSLAGDDPDMLYHLAAVDGERGRLREAANLLERLLAIDPTYENAQRHLDEMRRLMGE